VIDLYLLHWKTDEIDMDHVCDQLSMLKHEGKILNWGISNFCDRDIAPMKDMPGVNQIEHNLLRHDLKTYEYMQTNRIEMMAHSILAGGDMVNHNLIASYCRTKRISVANLCYAWSKSFDCLPIMKISSMDHLIDATKPIDLAAHHKLLSAMMQVDSRK
jgi:diketogulonate reductase-like aldo/keto reductase